MFDSNQFFSGGAAEFYPKTIDQSLRFNDDDSARLTKTLTTPTNQYKWTWSGWVKYSTSTADKVLFSSYDGSDTSNRALISFDNGVNIGFTNWTGGTRTRLISNAVFRDPSAWYHIVVQFDSTQATDSNRTKIYVNGEQVTSFSSAQYIAQNESEINKNGEPHQIGSHGTGSYFDGYMAEIHFTDGNAYTADAFGELKSGIWVAKAPSVTYGTNGFHLDFANSADIGNDISGNGNDWTPNNFTASDVVLDSPTDNFCTLNPLKSVDVVFSDGNLVCTHAPSSWRNARSSIGLPPTGKYYAEVEMVTTSIYWQVGVVTDAFSNTTFIGAASDDNSFGWQNGVKLPANTSYGSSGVAGDIFMIAVDRDAGELYLGKNGTWFESSNPATNTSPMISGLPTTGELFFAAGMYAGAKHIWNFGQQDFTYTPPTGYLALSTANLPDPVIDPAQDASPADHFGTLLWTGNTDTGTRTITDATSGVTGEVNFTPDWVWTKSRSATGSHALFDVVRGANKYLTSNGNGAEITNPSSGYLDSFTDGGFVAQEGSSNFANLNTNGTTYVAWNWKAGTSFSNSAGTNGASIASSGSANTTSGFSIVSYTGDSTGTDGTPSTVAHGLSQAPEMIMFKTLDTYDGAVYHSGLTSASYRLVLFSASGNLAEASDNGFFNGTAPTSSVFSIGSRKHTNSNGGMIAYCFHSVPQYSKVFSYTGNGSADGVFVHLGFKPAFIITKRTDSTGDWHMYDAERDTYNVVYKAIWANYSSAEYLAYNNVWDFLSNGVKARTSSVITNASGATYIGIAFAENPFKYSTAR